MSTIRPRAPSPTQFSSIAIKIGAAQTIILNILSGAGSRAPGRGYAAYDTDLLMNGPLFYMYMLTTMVAPPYNVIATVMSPLGVGPAGTNMNLGFPWTTGQIIVRGTGTAGMGVLAGATVMADGFDTMTAMGARNLQLVAGGLAQASIQGPSGAPNCRAILRAPREARPTPGARGRGAEAGRRNVLWTSYVHPQPPRADVAHTQFDIRDSTPRKGA